MSAFRRARVDFRFATAATAVAAALLATSCGLEPPQIDPARTIEESFDLPGAVVFRSEGDPDDAPWLVGEVLALEDAVRLAIERSPEIQAALARVRAAQAEAELAGLLPNPILSLVFRFPEGGGAAEVEAGLAADLLSILQRPRRASAAGSRLEAAAAGALTEALDVVYETREIYSQVQAHEAAAPLLQERLRLFERLGEVAQARFEAGEGSRHDVLALESERLAAEVEAARREQELRVARIALARRIGEPSGAAAWRLEPWRGAPEVATEESRWIAAALRARPELLAIEWEIRARGDDAALAEWSAFDGASIGAEAERAGDWSAGPGVAVPLPIADDGSAGARRARAREAEIRHRRTETRRRVIEEVRASLQALAGAQQNLSRVVNELLPLQERRRSEIEAAYRAGHVDVTALLLAEQALQAALTQRVELEHEHASAQARLERAVGGPTVLAEAAVPPGE